MRLRRMLRPAIGFAIAGIFLYLTVRRLEWGAIAHALRSAAVAPLVVGVLLLAGGYAVRLLRWWLMLREGTPGLSYGACARPFLASFALNNTMPLRAGDLVRAFGFRESLRTPGSRILGTLVVERVLDLLALLTIFFGALVVVGPGAVPHAMLVLGAVIGAGCLAALALLVLAPGQVRRVLLWALTLGPLAKRGQVFAGQFADAFQALGTPRRALRLVALSYLGWVFEGGLYAAVAWSLGLGLHPVAPWFALATGTLATLLPSSPGYVGTFDYFVLVALRAFGVAEGPAAAYALLTHVLLWAPVTLAGALVLLTPRSRAAWRRAERAPEVV